MAGAALCEARSADFAAGTVLCKSRFRTHIHTPLTDTHSHSHPHLHSHSHPHLHSHSHPTSLSLTLTHTPRSLTLTLTLTLTHTGVGSPPLCRCDSRGRRRAWRSPGASPARSLSSYPSFLTALLLLQRLSVVKMLLVTCGVIRSYNVPSFTQRGNSLSQLSSDSWFVRFSSPRRPQKTCCGRAPQAKN